MALPTTGSLSFKQIQTEFGGTDPIRISKYIRGGLLVPGVDPRTTTTANRIFLITISHGSNGTSGTVTVSNVYNRFLYGYQPSSVSVYVTTTQSEVRINGNQVLSTGNNASLDGNFNVAISPSSNGSFTVLARDGGYWGAGDTSFYLNATTYSQPLEINTGIPTTTNNMSLAGFRGARRL
jgi:hypothetical protein